MTNALIFLISTFATLFCSALFLRAWIFWRRIPYFNPYCAFIYKLTDFIVVPVRKIIPSSSNIDFPSLIIAYIICLVQLFLTTKLAINSIDGLSEVPVDMSILPIAALKIFINGLLSMVLWLGIVYAILSWISPLSPFQSFLRALLEPILSAIRQTLPKSLQTAPIDISLMLLMIGIIALQMIVV
ncbi:YggT family protein [Pelistega suis]|uniref:YggT family protein n=1 Tax=Pelistega suis TaxID=1631957 RepID=A0A849NZ74_9BURK|nr:YggT family protein [Pelistega suis]NOL50859.1 YggT family protein [Pelistega suis]